MKSDHLSKDDVQAILNAAIADQEGYLFIRLLAKTGRRIGELMQVRVKDIDFTKHEVVTIIEKKKKGATRTMFIDEPTCALLANFIQAKGLKRDDKVFRKTVRAYRNKVYKYAAKAGLEKNVSPHAFRHYVVTSLRKAGWAWEDIALITGHHPLSVRYYDHTDAYLKEVDFREAAKEL